MAEGLTRALASPDVEVASAGTRPTRVHPLAIEVMRERCLDISSHSSKAIEDLSGEFDYVITLCDETQNCPLVAAKREQLHWSLPDPVAAPGGDEERLAVFRRLREELESRLIVWLRGTGLANKDAPAERLERVRRQLARYGHPLLDFGARTAGEGVEVEVLLKHPVDGIAPYRFLMHQRELDHAQFPWAFQRQLYDCLHDYLIEMFTRNPQCQD